MFRLPAYVIDAMINSYAVEPTVELGGPLEMPEPLIGFEKHLLGEV